MNAPSSFYQKRGKRIMDLALALAGLVLLSPLFLLIALLVRVTVGSPVLFRHTRPGLGGRPFVLLKFRSMTNERDAAGELLPDEQRKTPFGMFLRASSLDELPELFNVLKGEMSLVGPRPLMMAYLPRYSPRQRRRHEARPGITGWAQVHGRNLLGWPERFEHDVWYIDHVSPWLDVKILAATFFAVLSRRGISAPEHFSAPEFMGETPAKETHSRGGKGPFPNGI